MIASPEYDRKRDFPAVKGPSYLSVHLRFGTVSIRRLARIAHELMQGGDRGAEVWLSELIWRDFYHQVMHHHPHAMSAAFRPEFRTYFFNSLVVSLSTVVITVTLGLLAAYSFTRAQLAVMSVLIGLVVLAQMFPHSAIIIPIYKMMRSANLLNTHWSLILAYVSVTLPVAIWMLRAFMARLPVELDEAAAVDGCGPFRTFFSVILPLCRPGIVATAVFVLIVTWQEFLFALSFTSTKDMRTLPVGMIAWWSSTSRSSTKRGPSALTPRAASRRASSPSVPGS